MNDSHANVDPLTSRVAGALATLAAWALLCVVVASIVWRFAAPRPQPAPRAQADADPVRAIAAAHLFGDAPGASPVSAPSATDARLIGIFAAGDGRGRALFRLAQGPVLVASGNDIAPGFHLDAVHVDRVVVTENGARRDIALRSAAASRASVASAPVATASASTANCKTPSGFKGGVYRINAEMLAGVMNAPDTWKKLLQAGPGALVVRDESGFAAMLGLKNGDRLERANGIALAIPDDVVGAVLQPLTRNLPVYVSGLRDGQQQQWFYVNAGACPA